VVWVGFEGLGPGCHKGEQQMHFQSVSFDGPFREEEHILRHCKPAVKVFPT